MADINQDPSMEEILASIKRVIAEDGRAALASSRGRNGGQRHEPEQQVDQAPDDDVLELSDPVSDEDRLISEGSAAASRQSLAVLAAMRQQNEAPASSPVGDGPLEAVVRDMLRPILKEWLDERLPEIVEDMVAREIARITGKSF
jgi:cell pole-organizing protein PopZ